MFGRKDPQAGRFGAQQHVSLENADAVDHLPAHALEVVRDRVVQVKAMQGRRDQLPFPGPGEAGDKVLGEGMRVGGRIRVMFPLPRRPVQEIQAVFRGNPKLLPGRKEIGQIGPLPVLEGRDGLLRIQDTRTGLPDLVQAPLQPHPDRSVSVHILEDEIDGGEPVVAVG